MWVWEGLFLYECINGILWWLCFDRSCSLIGGEKHIFLCNWKFICIFSELAVNWLLAFLQLNRYWIDFNKWEVFVNDDCTRTFLSVEVTTSGLNEVQWNYCWFIMQNFYFISFIFHSWILNRWSWFI